jgi:hypothetical protein
MLLIGTIPAVWLVTLPAVLLPLPARWGERSALMPGFRRAQATQKLSIDGAVG